MTYDVQIVDGEHDPSFTAEMVLFGKDGEVFYFEDEVEFTKLEGHWESVTVTHHYEETMASDPELERLIQEEEEIERRQVGQGKQLVAQEIQGEEHDPDDHYRNAPPP